MNLSEEKGELHEEGRETISPLSDSIVTASRTNPDWVARCKQHVLLQVPPTAQTFPLQLHLHHNLALGFAIPILLLESPCSFVGPSVTKFQQNFSAQYLDNEKSYRRSAGVKTT